ncbi:unnamed protein product [Acanthoscelides obtectus]|uniref:Uncharacterized protein n=1 Tax=Acanthoscelides obtectus TaxID=200917 RepID=A0A9P0PYD3_ACAOB|nr:unnamed protein product [Acanthoscelides obtectus]CAK1635436.1 hypothetical protein AOBTE_LOCUS9273 [Acanthoscelides obtectus]
MRIIEITILLLALNFKGDFKGDLHLKELFYTKFQPIKSFGVNITTLYSMNCATYWLAGMVIVPLYKKSLPFSSASKDYFIEKAIPLSNIISVATDEAPGMVGRYRGFISSFLTNLEYSFEILHVVILKCGNEICHRLDLLVVLVGFCFLRIKWIDSGLQQHAGQDQVSNFILHLTRSGQLSTDQILSICKYVRYKYYFTKKHFLLTWAEISYSSRSPNL